ncbi:xanthine dehydrogenase family protein molybdopterin-binding subunit [Roseomonas sp. M0104]|uniref:Xanthine dehydrogenase family protein molybdopterin-binding subunit n=1 Tax=Teichococcus coralli TaxID=2545983 RepID=A0A845B998_9PROT|nr:molybdopterin cofactor-binding domain-containing protein [Pseudoroseomonas coralli]MXP62674.1 xanthine dehydrogenase family protein molybdopterin-binding subunit [Pseudoroseomonas coralli]
MNLAYSLATGGAEAAHSLPGSLAVQPRLSRWLRIAADGAVTLTPGKVELGQGILTALAQIAAEELDVALERIRLRPAATPDSPDEGVTSGSLSVQECGMALRQACAEARAIFLSVAAQRSGVPMEAIRVEDGAFFGPEGRLGSYGELAEQDLLETDATGQAAPKPPAAHRIVGRPVPRLDLMDKLTGAPRFLHDLRLPEMLHARVIRPPARRARLVALRDGALPPGARLVRDGSFLAVVAPSETAAEAAAARLASRAEWQAEDSLPEMAALPDWLAAAAAEESTVAERDAELPPAAHQVSARFFRPFLAHASVAPSCAVARWQEDALEVWTHSQGVYNLRADLALALRMPAERIAVRHAEGAGCYGHNGADDVALDAALAARACPGRPVRLRWSRAQELAWSPHSPATLVRVEASLDAAGRLRHWRSEITGNGHSSRPGRARSPTLLAAQDLEAPFPHPVAVNAPAKAGGGAQRNAEPGYAIPALHITLRRLTEMPLRSSALRGLGALINVWANESVMDELAERIGEDPLAFRLRHLEDARTAAVLREVAGLCGWPRGDKAEGVGRGLAAARYKGSGAWCAVAAEVEAAEVVRVRRLWIAADVGQVINPDGALNQLEGGAIQATSIALKEEVAFNRRTVTSDAWERYPVLRFSEVPKVEARLLSRPEEPPLGAGECSMGPTIAAIAAAIHDALGVRPRALPFTPDNLAAAMEP